MEFQKVFTWIETVVSWWGLSPNPIFYTIGVETNMFQKRFSDQGGDPNGIWSVRNTPQSQTNA